MTFPPANSQPLQKETLLCTLLANLIPVIPLSITNVSHLHEISTKRDPALKFEPCEKHPKIKYKIIYNKVELPKPTCDPTKVRNFLIGNTKNCQFIFANSRALLSKPRKKLTLQKNCKSLCFVSNNK